MWERGLKLVVTCLELDEKKVAPRVGAWIETIYIELNISRFASLPVWERGLKQGKMLNTTLFGMSLPVWERGLKRGNRAPLGRPCGVAPRVGAWIETA